MTQDNNYPYEFTATIPSSQYYIVTPELEAFVCPHEVLYEWFAGKVDITARVDDQHVANDINDLIREHDGIFTNIHYEAIRDDSSDL